jgi:peptidoglycan/LPS O-acetylase OafA/YrhL
LQNLVLTYPKVAPGRVQMLDELRGFAILLVLIYHVGGVTGYPNNVHGDLGVDIFVMLSGAMLAMSDRSDEGFWKFLYRRMVRIIPAYWIALTAYAIANHHFLGYRVDPKSLIVHYLCIHGMWGDSYLLDFNDSFWFLALAFILYVLFAFLRRLLGRLDILLCIGFVVSFLIAWVSFHEEQPATFVHLGLRPTAFFLGIPFGLLLKKGTLSIPMTGWFAVGIIVSLYGMFIGNMLVGYTMCGFSLCIGYFAARSSAEDAGNRRLCTALAWIGTYSYEIFLVHQPLIGNYNGYWQVYGRWLGIPEEFITQWGVVVGLALTAFASIYLHRFCGWVAGILTPRWPKPALA